MHTNPTSTWVGSAFNLSNSGSSWDRHVTEATSCFVPLTQAIALAATSPPSILTEYTWSFLNPGVLATLHIYPKYGDTLSMYHPCLWVRRCKSTCEKRGTMWTPWFWKLRNDGWYRWWGCGGSVWMPQGSRFPRNGRIHVCSRCGSSSWDHLSNLCWTKSSQQTSKVFGRYL